MLYKNYTTLGVESETKILGSSIEKESRIVLGCKASVRKIFVGKNKGKHSK